MGPPDGKRKKDPLKITKKLHLLKKKRDTPSVDRKQDDPIEDLFLFDQPIEKTYEKERRTCGYNGFVYEIKLAGVIHLNLKQNDKVDNFLLATNIPAAHPFDDICFKINWKDVDRKPTVVFIQAKLKLSQKKPEIKLGDIFKGYKDIQNKFNDGDGLFKGKFDECECYFILYTNEDFRFKTVSVTDRDYCPELNDIITVADGKVSRLNNAEKKKVTVKWSENDNLMWERFLNSLLLFTGQANEEDVEAFLKECIACHLPPSNRFPVTREAATALYIKEFENWWKLLDEAPYLTEKHDFLKISFDKVLNKPVMTSLNIIYESKIKHHYTFTDAAVSSLNLQDHACTVIIAEDSLLTVVKVRQHLRSEEHVVIDLESIANLRYEEREELCKELKTSDENVLILVCDKIYENDAFKDIGEAAKNRKRILISNNNKLSQKFKELFRVGADEEYWEVHDDRNRLTDLSEESQSNILETITLMFQDKEVKLADIVDDESKKYVKGNVLHQIFTGDTIIVGKLIVDCYYDKIKHLWIDRSIAYFSTIVKRDVCLKLKALTDIEEDVVLLTAQPGMGKSTLLSHLSIKTKEENPKVWIVRINLLEYSEEFSKWKEKETVIDLLETLKLMCQVLLCKKLGRGHDVKLTLEEKDNVVYLNNSTADPLTELELNLFLHFYFEREVILLFDGFDEIWPHYTDVVIKCLKTIIKDPRKHRVWITSRSYDAVKTILRRELELESCDINMFKGTEYLQKFWENTLKVDELNDAQLENVKKLFDFISFKNVRLTSSDYSINGIIYSAALHLSCKIKNTHIPLWKYNRNYHEVIKPNSYVPPSDCTLCSCCWYCMIMCYRNYPFERSSNPLLLYLVAVDVEENIKNGKECEKWYLDVETYTVYERFLENKIKKRYQEKNGMNIYIPDVITAYEKELADSILKHKKLGAYATFYIDMPKLFSEKDLEEIHDFLDKLRNAEEKSGIIVSGFIWPHFVHRTFAEYFAVEYICDCLKIENVSDNTIFSCFDCLFIPFYGSNEIPRIFDQKMTIDKKLMSILEKNKDVIFEWLQRRLLVFDTAMYRYKTIRSFFCDIVEYALGKFNANITISDEQRATLREFLQVMSSFQCEPEG